MLHLTRTSLVLLGLTTTAATATAASVVRETVVHNTTTSTEIALSADTVLCSSADYGALFLKVLIPKLAEITLLDHQNLGAGAPCVASGMCKPGNRPSDIIDASRPTEVVDVTVQAVRIDEIDSDAQTCTTLLREHVDVKIRNIAFQHERFASLGTRPYSDCVATTAGNENKADRYDEPGQAATASTGGGCDAGTGGAGAGLLVLALGAVVIRRRK